MRMVASSAKSTGRRRAICSGLQAFAHRRSFVVRADGFARTRPGRDQEPRSEPQRRQPTVPRHRFLTPRCAQASPALGGEQRARRAIALSSHDTRGRRFGWRRCAAALWRLSMPLARAGERPAAWSSPEREERDLLPLRKREIRHRAASPIANIDGGMPLPSEHRVLPPAGHRHRRSIFTRRARRNRCPKSPPLLSPCDRRSTW